MKEKFLLLMFLFVQLSVFAQDDDGPPTDDPPLAPIDAWTTLFLLLAVIYTAYYFSGKIKHQNKLS